MKEYEILGTDPNVLAERFPEALADLPDVLKQDTVSYQVSPSGTLIAHVVRDPVLNYFWTNKRWLSWF